MKDDWKFALKFLAAYGIVLVVMITGLMLIAVAMRALLP